MEEKNPEITFVEILKDAATIAQRSGRAAYNTFHLLLSIIRKDSFLREWLSEKGVKFNDLLASQPIGDSVEPFMGQLLSRIRSIANTAGQPRKPIHMLFGMLGFGQGGLAFDALCGYTDPAALLREILQEHWLRNPPMEEVEEEKEDEKRGLARYGIDFTKFAREGKLHGVIGRDAEIASIVRVLAQKDMDASYDEAINNPVLLGPAGTGKTALAKAIAVLIAQRDPRVQILWDYKLVYLKLGTLQAGTGVRGTLEAKLEEILADATKGKCILFFDELHILMGLGKSEGSPGIEEILKPILAEGLSCIGATTTEEWRREIETKNPPFAERWVPVIIEQPDEEKTRSIVHGAIHDLARRHIVHFPEEVMSAAVTLGRKYMVYEASPRREIDKILNGAGARAKLDGRSAVTVEDVLAVIQQVTGIPVNTQQVQQERVVNAFEILSAKIFGQEESNLVMASALQRFYSGMRDANKPLVVLMLGPTGVGKTLTAKTIADTFFFGRMVRIDMSEYQEKHSVARLIGSPPGYVGYEEPGQLTNGIKRIGEGVVLEDEIDKAHLAVFLAQLGLLDEGRLTDGKGNTVDAKNCVILLTSNMGSHLFGAVTSGGFGFGAESKKVSAFEAIKQQVITAAKSGLPPELWNRIDEVIVFKPHNVETVRKIAIDLLEKEKIKCETKGFNLNWSPVVVEYLASRGYDPNNGARPMKRLVMREVQTLLAKALLNNEVQTGDNVLLEVAQDAIFLSKA